MSLSLTDLLQEALAHYHEPAWLGEHSPLARPYFLGKWLSSTAFSNEERGKALQQLIMEALQQLTGRNAEPYRTLLQTTYLRQPRVTQEALYRELSVAHNTYARHRKQAVAMLLDHLLQLACPALRLETPPRLAPPLDREQVLADSFQALQMGKTVSLLGVSGVGKTTLAVDLAQRWVRARRARLPTGVDEEKTFRFWYTIRPDLNDQVESLVFALGLFAHQHGISELWHELVAGQGKLVIKEEKMLEMVRHCLQQLQAPLLCFDEFDALQPTINAHHAAFVRFVENLRPWAALLLSGQSQLVDADFTQMLTGLTAAGQAALLRQHRVGLPADEQDQLYRLTRGNPRLIQLFITTVQSGEAADHLLDLFQKQPTLTFIFGRTLQRLTETERDLLCELSVFPEPAPIDHWQTAIYGSAVESLLIKQLLQSDITGGIEMPPVYRPLIERALTDERRRALHKQAALLRSQMAAYTAAAYHWIAAGNPAQALMEWTAHQTQEIAQGQAATAVKLFRQLTTTPLAVPLQEQIKLLCGELEYLTGQPQVALADIQTLLHKTSIAAITANELAGKIYNDDNDFDKARQAFQRSLHLAEALVEVRMALAHKGLAWGYLEEAEIQRAEYEIELAAYQIENMRGNLARDRCDYAQARQHYQTALQSAEEAEFGQGIARTSNELAGLLMRQGAFAECFVHLDRAYAIYEKIGKIRAMAGCCSSRAVAYNLAGDHPAALKSLDQAEKLLENFLSIETNLRINLLQAGAEAHLGLGNLDEAAQLAYKVNQLENTKMNRDAWWVLGEVAARRKNWIEAEDYLQGAIQQAEADRNNADIYLAGIAHRSLALVYWEQGKLEPAHQEKEQALTRFVSINLSNEVQKTYEVWAKVT